MTITKKLFGVILLFVSAVAVAQKDGRDFKAIDDAIKKMGALDSMTMGTISNLVTKNYSDKTDQARAIFDWIAYNISFDYKSARNGGSEKNTSPEVLLSRKATAAGYANLFQDMCSIAGIRCLTVDGYIKNNVEQIGESKPELNHTWDVVQLGQSPEAWYIVDPCWGSGYTDPEFKSYTKAFNPDYFFADLTIFNWQHYPGNTAWHLGPKPKNRGDFFDLPLVKSMAYELGLKRFTPNSGNVKAKAGKPFAFSFQINSNEEINKVTLAIGEGKKIINKEVKFSANGSSITFNYTFPEEDNFPVSVYVNGKELVAYNITVE